MEFNLEVNAFDYSNLVKGGNKEIEAAIKLYKELGCPDPSKIQAEEAVIHPIKKLEDGKVVFGAYCYESYKPDMDNMFEGFKSHSNVVEVYDDFEIHEGYDDEFYVDGEYFVVVKL